MNLPPLAVTDALDRPPAQSEQLPPDIMKALQEATSVEEITALKAKLTEMGFAPKRQPPRRGQPIQRGDSTSSTASTSVEHSGPSRPVAEVVKEIRSVYSTYVPEKTRQQVDEILAKFVGREEELLRKVKKKYQNTHSV